MIMMTRALIALALCTAVAAAAMPAHAQETVTVAKRVIYPGENVTADLLENVPLRRHLRNPDQIVMMPEQIAGKVARRTILPGRLIAVNSVRAAHLVESGKAVQASLSHGQLLISVTAIPLQAGAAGDMIRLRNADSGTTFNGIVLEDGTVQVPTS